METEKGLVGWCCRREEPSPVGTKLLAFYVDINYRYSLLYDIVFILVQDNGAGQYRRLGIIDVELDYTRTATWYANPSCSYVTLLQDVIDSLEWEQQTVQLV
jgi:hypothetical protein